MQEIEIDTFSELHQIIENYDARTVIYRGVKSVRYPLIPKIGRITPTSSARSNEANEQEILRLFKEQALPYLDFVPSSDWTGWRSGSSMACQQDYWIGQQTHWSPAFLP